MSDILTKIKAFAVSLPEVTEEPHFEKSSFRVRKKIFLTFNKEFERITVKLTENDQSIYSQINGADIRPVPNAWGKQGWTNINIQSTAIEIITDAIVDSYIIVAPKVLSADVKQKFRQF
ncbi:MAG: MmcQ/YjbR family DNA-binding protein [Bacteroidia bacterium]